MRGSATFSKMSRGTSWRGLRHYSKIGSDLGLVIAPNIPLLSSTASDSSPGDSQDYYSLENLKKCVFSKIKSKRRDAELVFQRSAALQTNPEAKALMVKHYVMEYDFTTARAFLLQSLDTVDYIAVSHFLTASFRVSENPQHIEDVAWACIECSKFSNQELAAILSTALIGLKILKDSDRFTTLRKWCKIHHLDRTLPHKQLELYELYVNEEFEQALELGRVIHAGVIEGTGSLVKIELPYRWVVTHFAKKGDFSAIDRVYDHMKMLEIDFDTAFTNTVLTFLPEMYPDIEPVSWFKLCENKGWPLSVASMTILVDWLAHSFPDQGKAIWETHNKVTKHSAENMLIQHLKGGEFTRPIPHIRTRHSPFRKAIVKAIESDPSRCIHILDSMRRQGICPSHKSYVFVYEHLARIGDSENLALLRERMIRANMSYECAGPDLATLERQFEVMHTEIQKKDMVELLKEQYLNSYLTQYSLSVHDSVQLTRIGYLFFRYLNSPDMALQCVDYIRQDGAYSRRNHHDASLRLAMRARYTMDVPLRPWIEKVLDDKPLIFFPFGFRRELASYLVRQNELPDESLDSVMPRLRKHNDWVVSKVLSQVELMYEHLKEVVASKA